MKSHKANLEIAKTASEIVNRCKSKGYRALAHFFSQIMEDHFFRYN